MSLQFLNWLGWFKDHEASEYKQNPHTAAWLDHDFVALDEKAWTEDRLRMKAVRYRQFYTCVYGPAVNAAETLQSEADKKLAIKTLNGMLSQLESDLMSLYR